VDGEIALARRGRADRVRLVGQQDVERLAIGLGEHGDRRDPLLAAGADHPHGDLAPVGDEDLGQRTAMRHAATAGKARARRRSTRSRPPPSRASPSRAPRWPRWTRRILFEWYPPRPWPDPWR